MKAAFAALCAIQIAVSQFGYTNKQLPQDTLAVVGGKAVTARDYLERFELMPWPLKENKARLDYTKKEFLYSMVAEKLLALEASSQQIGTDSVTMEMQDNLMRMFVRDELYKQEVTPKVVVSGDEIRKGANRYAYELELEILGIISREEGNLFHTKYSQSKNKRGVYRKFLDSLFVPIDTIQIAFGSGDVALENAAYEIGKDSLSKPVESAAYGLVMARLLKRYTNPQSASLSGPDRIHKVKNIISQRKEDTLASKVFASVTAPQRAEANSDLFFMLTDSVYRRLSADSSAYWSKNVYMLPVALLEQIGRNLGPALNNVFVTIDGGEPMTLGQVIAGLKNNYIVFPNVQRQYIQWVMNNNIKTVIQNELLAREALKKNLHQSENVRHDLSTWMDNRKGMLLLKRIIDSVEVDDDEIAEEYGKNPASYGATVLVKLREILVDSTALAKSLKERLNRGEDFAVLAKKYSKRKEWGARGGESDYLDVKKMGDLGVFAATAAPGEIEGPWRVKDGITIFTVIDRKVLDDSIRENFNAVKENVRGKLLLRKRQKTLDQYIGSLARKYNVRLDETALQKVETTSHSMVTWRHIGFGGRIMAVPQMNRQTEWIYEWRRQERLNQ